MFVPNAGAVVQPWIGSELGGFRAGGLPPESGGSGEFESIAPR